MAHQAEQVFAIEPDAALADAAKANLRKAGVQNVRVLQQAGASGLAAEAPFDAIVLSGSVAEVPAGLLAQLRVGTGRLIAIVGDDPVMQARLFTRVGPDDYRSPHLFETSPACPALPSCLPSLSDGAAVTGGAAGCRWSPDTAARRMPSFIHARRHSQWRSSPTPRISCPCRSV